MRCDAVSGKVHLDRHGRPGRASVGVGVGARDGHLGDGVVVSETLKHAHEILLREPLLVVGQRKGVIALLPRPDRGSRE